MKILCSDYDGTLSHGGITAEKLNAIRAWRTAGNKFGIISGRRASFYWDLKAAQPDLELDFMATCNGAIVLDGNGRILTEARCTDVPTEEIVKDLLSRGSTLVFLNGIDGDPFDYLCVVKRAEDRPNWVAADHTVTLESLPAIKSFYQITPVTDTPEEAIPLEEQIRACYGDRLTPLRNGRCIDAVPLGINKAEGVRRIASHFGASLADMITVGDNINDADMLREFRSYAMESGTEYAKSIAGRTVADVTDIFEIEG